MREGKYLGPLAAKKAELLAASPQNLKAMRAEYAKRKRKFLSENKACFCFGKLGVVCSKIATDVHHRNGRRGAMLIDVRYWIPVCRTAHNWIHGNIQSARELGLIALGGDWNKPS